MSKSPAGNSMTETGNNPLESAEQLPQSLDIKKAIGQHLQALAKTGMDTIPRGKGRFEFLLEPRLEPNAAPGTAEQVREKTPASYLDSSVATGLPTDSIQPNSKEVDPVNAGNHVMATVGQHDGNAQDATKISLRSTDLTDSGNDEAYGPSLDFSQRQSVLAVLQSEIACCTKCPELVANRTQTVFGVGNITPRLVFVGEGPGADEDKLGEPFVGAAGQLLNKIMGASRINRQDVYILNTVKCRPPANRNPSQTELDHCWGYAQAQLEILQPEFICCLGSVAAKRLLNTNQSLGRLRQRFHQYRGSRVIVTYHPAYLLRTESAKRHVWEDMKLLMKEMGVDLAEG